MYPIFGKVAKTVTQTKMLKISTLEFNLKVLNIYIYPVLKPQNTHRPWFKIANLVEIVTTNCFNKKYPKMSLLLWANSSYSKNYTELPKVAQWAKFAQSGHPVRRNSDEETKFYKIDTWSLLTSLPLDCFSVETIDIKLTTDIKLNNWRSG